MNGLACRFCARPLHHAFADLGTTPLSNEFLSADQLGAQECFFPLKAYVCESCFLVQLPEFESPDSIFSDYAYFSSYSDSFLEHVRCYVDAVVERFSFDQRSQVVELASNDGYLLQYFKRHGVPCYGVEPAANVARVAQERGIPTVVEFFGEKTARHLLDDKGPADLIVGNNVLAHVPDLNDFVAGMKQLLHARGVITMEFPHLMRLMELNQYDTIYHEHFSYFSFLTAQRVFAHHGLRIFDVEEIWTHGGSLRIYACHGDDTEKAESGHVEELVAAERAAGYDRLSHYLQFQQCIDRQKRELLRFLIEAKDAGKLVVGYGAPAKGNTLLNYCGIRTDLLAYTVDRSPHKQGKFLPGTRIPIHAPTKLAETQPSYVLILPWNIKDEIVEQMAEIRDWGGQFVVPIPEVSVCG